MIEWIFIYLIVGMGVGSLLAAIIWTLLEMFEFSITLLERKKDVLNKTRLLWNKYYRCDCKR